MKFFDGIIKEEKETVGLTPLKYAKGFDAFQHKLYNSSLIILTIGARGNGKSALNFNLMEDIKNKTRKKCYLVGKNPYLPSWINQVSDIGDVKDDSVVLYDEGGVQLSSRRSMSKDNQDISNVMKIARHKGLTLLFISQNSSSIDIETIRMSDALLLKKGSLLQRDMERDIIKKLYSKVNFEGLDGIDFKSAVYVHSDDFMGMCYCGLPTFWNECISMSYGGTVKMKKGFTKENIKAWMRMDTVAKDDKVWFYGIRKIYRVVDNIISNANK